MLVVIIVVRCPTCKKENTKPYKTWKYGKFFTAEAYVCDCGTKFREYKKDGKPSFMLKVQEGKGYVKV